MEGIINSIINLFSGLVSMKFGKELIVFIISLLPVLELRGGLIAASLLRVNPVNAYIVSIIGNLLPIPFILIFLSKILSWMEKSKIRFFNSIASWLKKKADKNKSKIEKYGYIGLILFVGIPLPGTGAWTGSLVATALNLNKKKAFLCTIVGVLIASVIMMLLSYGLISNLIN